MLFGAIINVKIRQQLRRKRYLREICAGHFEKRKNVDGTRIFAGKLRG